jgi:hypothetical protein
VDTQGGCHAKHIVNVVEIDLGRRNKPPDNAIPPQRLRQQAGEITPQDPSQFVAQLTVICACAPAPSMVPSATVDAVRRSSRAACSAQRFDRGVHMVAPVTRPKDIFKRMTKGGRSYVMKR